MADAFHAFIVHAAVAFGTSVGRVAIALNNLLEKSGERGRQIGRNGNGRSWSDGRNDKGRCWGSNKGRLCRLQRWQSLRRHSGSCVITTARLVIDINHSIVIGISASVSLSITATVTNELILKTTRVVRGEFTREATVLTQLTSVGSLIIKQVAVTSRYQILFVNLANVAAAASKSGIHITDAGVTAQMTSQPIDTLSIAIATFSNLTRPSRTFGGSRGGFKTYDGKVGHGIDGFAEFETLDPSVLRVFLLKEG
jgi:hypothetical protein